MTIHLPEWNEQYHSKHGAIQEAVHVFINAGFHYYLEKHTADKISILEIGFGTGLNCLLTLKESEHLKTFIEYTGVEAFPIKNSEIAQLNYPILTQTSVESFNLIHDVPWETYNALTSYFLLRKLQKNFEDITATSEYNLIYFDAFGARVQPNLWTERIFSIMYKALQLNGVLVTYAANGNARRAMQAAGFLIEKLPGPPGKREMLRATKAV